MNKVSLFLVAALLISSCSSIEKIDVDPNLRVITRKTIQKNEQYTRSEKEEINSNHDVTFVSQAPFGDWDDTRQQDGCEEASTIMAYMWATDTNFTNQQALDHMLEQSDWQKETFGSYKDTSVQDTADRLLSTYWEYDNYEVVEDVSPEDLVSLLDQGVIIAPMNGQSLSNPNFTQPGPETHMLLITGYDTSTKEFITNDPGTKRGEGFRYAKMNLYGSLYNYMTTGSSTQEDIKSVILVKKQTVAPE